MNEEQKKIKPEPVLKEKDLIELAAKIWANRRFVCKVLGISILIGLVVGFSIPKEYTAEVVMAPEVSNKASLGGSMGALASMAGINLGSMTGEDAIFPQLYPKIIKSVPFLTGLFDVPVKTKKGDISTTLYDYLENHQKSSWWSIIFKIPGKIIKKGISIFKKEDVENNSKKVDAFWLTKKQMEIAQSIEESIVTFVDKKNDVITLSVTMQDPLIAASLADTIKNRLQETIIEYRTKKARNDLKFAEKLFNDAQKHYFSTQQAYAKYVDENMNVVMARYQAKETQLKNDMDLAYAVYSQVAQQMQMAKAKVQESTPAFAVIQPSSVPLLGSNLGKIAIILIFSFLGILGASIWLLLKDTLKKWRNKFI